MSDPQPEGLYREWGDSVMAFARRDLVALTGENEALRAELAKTHAEAKWLCRIIDDDGLECLPGCDEVAHEELCPYASPGDAYRALRAEVERLRGLVLGVHYQRTDPSMSGREMLRGATVPGGWRAARAALEVKT